MAAKPIIGGDHEASHGSFKSYTVGFGISIILTVLAFALVGAHILDTWLAISVIIGLALVQLYVQVVFFLHLGRESSQRWNLTVFVMMLMIVFILVAGSLWIMQNLNYHHDHRSPDQLNEDIIHDEGYR